MADNAADFETILHRALRDNYFNKESYARDTSGQPWLLVFGPITFKTESEWSEILRSAGEPVNFMTLWYHNDRAGTTASGEFSWIHQDVTDSITHFYTNRASNFENIGGCIYAGFHDFYAEGNAGSTMVRAFRHITYVRINV